MHHLSKFLQISSKEIPREENFLFYTKLLHFTNIFQINHKVYVTNYWWTKRYTKIITFDDPNQMNISSSIFPNKIKNLERFPIHIFFHHEHKAYLHKWQIHSLWNYFFVIVIKKMNASVAYFQMNLTFTDEAGLKKRFNKFLQIGMYDVLYTSLSEHQLFQGYSFEERCFIAPLSPSHSIYELVLFLPLDIFCWIWLALTFAISALVWRIFEGPNSQWNILFGLFALFVGQCPKIKT